MNKLFFVNLGGYDPDEFTELHKNVLLVAPDAKTAKAKAKESQDESSGQRLLQRPALMFAVKGFEQTLALWFSPSAMDGGQCEGRSWKTMVGQALMRGLFTA